MAVKERERKAGRGSKRSVFVSVLNRAAIILLIGTALSIVVNWACHLRFHRAADARHDLTVYANQFMDASDYLTDEVRAFAATGAAVHYDNYWNEVKVRRNREIGVAKLKEIGITEEEQAMIDRMSALSDGLVPLEAEAMELAAAGDIQGALGMVYSDHYNGTVTEIHALRDRFLAALDARSLADMRWAGRVYDAVSIVTWLAVAVMVMVQLLQKRGLYRLAYVDPLTGGDNYTAFREKMRASSGVSGSGYVVSADLREFSTINDSCGIAKGDQVIREMGKILYAEADHGELAAHVNGDRFVLFLHSGSRDELIRRIAGMREKMMDLSPVLEVPHIVPAFGIRAVDSPDQPERGYGDANLAKQRLKERAGWFYAFYDEETQQRVLENQYLEDHFDAALREREFEIWYQPKYDPRTGRMVGAEALVRWRRQSGETILPGKFIPLFERNGMIAQLDEYTFSQVCDQQRMWREMGLGVVPVSVNVSRASLYYPDIVERYLAIARRQGVPTDRVELEITESALGGEKMEELIGQFRDSGFAVLVDDFGSGYSSLATLTRRLFRSIKIDKSLIDCIYTPEGNALLASIIGLAHEFDMTVTAEGVEEAEQVDFLRHLSCDAVQGYYFARPMCAEDFQAILAHRL